ncbi:MAG: hypothetical protein ACRD98_06520, partial [Nitrososphaera sp.]
VSLRAWVRRAVVSVTSRRPRSFIYRLIDWECLGYLGVQHHNVSFCSETCSILPADQFSKVRPFVFGPKFVNSFSTSLLHRSFVPVSSLNEH